MPINSRLLQRLDAFQQTLMAQHAGGRGMPNATSGSERETFVRRFLEKVFPAHRRFSTGAITDSNGNVSGQVDIAVEYGFIPSFPMPVTEERLLLAESVALVIEVKSDLSAQWDEVRETVRKVKTLHRQLNAIVTFGRGPSAQIPCIAVGYTGHTTTDGLANRLETTREEERPDGALVIQSGCFCGFDKQTSGPLGLYALCIAINDVLGQLVFAAPNLSAYSQTQNET